MSGIRVLIALLLGFIPFSYAHSDDFFVRGLGPDDPSRLHVVVESLGPDAATIGLTVARIENRIRVRLAQASINVIPSTQYIEDGAYLYMNINVLNRAASICVELNRFVTFTAKGVEVLQSATTWDRCGLATLRAPDSSEGDYVMSLVDQMMDSFLADYFQANR